MTCRKFQDHLHEYVDESLENGEQAAARDHLERCPKCRRALQRVQSFGRAMEHALDRATESISIQPAFGHEILRAARAQQAERRSPRLAWHWLAEHPFRAFGGMAATLAGVTLLAFVL